MEKKDNYIFYHIVTFLIRIFGHLFFLDEVLGQENIPKEGKCILAGNHVSNYDAYFLFRGTKRPIHILGKTELFQGPFSFIFKWMHLIPVDRGRKSPEVIIKAIKLLNKDKIIGIFPEGTFHKKDIILPFKPGVIKMALDSKSPIVPFVIVGKIKFLGHPKVVYGQPIYLNEIKDEDPLKYLENVIIKMIKENS